MDPASESTIAVVASAAIPASTDIPEMGEARSTTDGLSSSLSAEVEMFKTCDRGVGSHYVTDEISHRHFHET